jgi:hypothetical protein
MAANLPGGESARHVAISTRCSVLDVRSMVHLPAHR